MAHPTTEIPQLTIGIDLGDRNSEVCVLDAKGDVVHRHRFTTTPAGVRKLFADFPQSAARSSCRVVLEAGTHSPWVSELLAEIGPQVVVANPSAMLQPGGKRRRKNDKTDAEALARIGRLDVKLLAPVQHRGPAARADLILIRARDNAVATRTSLINAVRGLLKSQGGRVPSCSAEAFHKRAADQIPPALQAALLPLVKLVGDLTVTIRAYDKAIDQLATTQYAETQRLTQITGVGNLTALAYVLTIEDHHRFARSRCVGPYLGLVPRQWQSSESDPALGISKAGDRLLRRLLVTAAHYILGPMNRVDSDLRRLGEAIESRGGKHGRKKAVIAVARRLAVLLHALWRTGAPYEPLRHAKQLCLAS